jgi:predicted outer membrane protein
VFQNPNKSPPLALWGRSLDRLQQERYRAWASVGAGEIVSTDHEKRLEALYEQASNEKDPEKMKQLICEILAVLEAHQQHLRDRGAGSSGDKAS